MILLHRIRRHIHLPDVIYCLPQKFHFHCECEIYRLKDVFDFHIFDFHHLETHVQIKYQFPGGPIPVLDEQHWSFPVLMYLHWVSFPWRSC